MRWPSRACSFIVLPLSAGQLAVLQEDRVGNSDLPDIMERSGKADELASLGREAELSRELRGVSADALDVLARVRIPELGRLRQAPDHLLMRALQVQLCPREFLESVAQLLRTPRDGLLE